MKPIFAATLLLGCVSVGANAQAPSTPPPSTPPATAPAVPPPASRATQPSTSDAVEIVGASALEAGANSFTEGQARSRLEGAGFTNIQNLTKDDAGFWRGRGTRNGTEVDVAMDFRGRIAAGPDVASLRPPSAPTGSAPPPATSR